MSSREETRICVVQRICLRPREREKQLTNQIFDYITSCNSLNFSLHKTKTPNACIFSLSLFPYFLLSLSHDPTALYSLLLVRGSIKDTWHIYRSVYKHIRIWKWVHEVFSVSRIGLLVQSLSTMPPWLIFDILLLSGGSSLKDTFINAQVFWSHYEGFFLERHHLKMVENCGRDFL